MAHSIPCLVEARAMLLRFFYGSDAINYCHTTLFILNFLRGHVRVCPLILNGAVVLF